MLRIQGKRGLLLLALGLMGGCASVMDVATHPGGKALLFPPQYASGVKTDRLPALPLAQAGKKLKVRNAGFWVGSPAKSGRNQVTYEYTLVLDKPYPYDVYQEAILANPDQANRPFVYHQVFKKGGQNMTIRHGPVKGLVLGQTYTLTLNLYADEARTQLLDSVVQPVVSPFDTRLGCLRMAEDTPLPLDTNRHCFNL
ncbi:MAG: hypothetical protein KA214_05720 [Neisseriaceae bacterium]|nr:hypothetical protein [Neisseriaceae bacterium]